MTERPTERAAGHRDPDTIQAYPEERDLLERAAILRSEVWGSCMFALGIITHANPGLDEAQVRGAIVSAVRGAVDTFAAHKEPDAASAAGTIDVEVGAGSSSHATPES